MDYESYLANREQLAHAGGFVPHDIPDHLFDFQQHLLRWAIEQGRGAIFADCGMGKTPMELAWAENVYLETGKPVLLLTPLAVGFQIVSEAEKFGHDAAMSRDGKVAAPVTVTNYEQLAKFDPADFGGVVCDESSAIKAFDGETRKLVTEFMRRIQYRLLGTATAAPNDYVELGTSSEALGELGHMDMLSRFFINKDRSVSSRGRSHGGGQGVEWRLKGHAEQPFWQWVASWARAIRKPSEYGYDDGPFVLPKLNINTHMVEAVTVHPEHLFEVPAQGLAEQREETRRTLKERCEQAAALLTHDDAGVAWCNLNDESATLTRMIDGAVEVSGSDSPEDKEAKLRDFTEGNIRVLVTKPKIGAWGLNWQHCAHMTYFPSHSYEQYYQAVRRSWRFGQQNDVTVDVITTEGGQAVLENLQRKAEQADRMFDHLVAHMAEALTITRSNYDTPLEAPSWLAH